MKDNGSPLQEEFLAVYTQYVKRDGAEKLLDFLRKSDYFTAPASARFHCSRREGLLEHSLNVYKRLLKLIKADFGEKYREKFSDETIAICGLLHDVCKIDYYVEDFKNVKDKTTGKWEEQPFYRVEERLPYGHGEKSVYIVNGFMRLTRDEALAINWHMGGFDDRAKANSMAISEAFNRCSLALYLHVADVMATFVDENSSLK